MVAGGVALTGARHDGAAGHPRRQPSTCGRPTSPYLYTLETDVSEGGQLLDTVTTTFGIRWITISPTQGVFINGRHIKLQGVDLHNDEGALGSVDNYDALWRQMSILKSEGVNAFRTSHNPPSPEMVDVCQQLGIVMMVEAFDAWASSGKFAQDYHLYFNQWSDYDIQEMVNESKNSPAVMMWSIGNEIPSLTSPQPADRAAAGLRHQSIDTTRPVVAGSDQLPLACPSHRPRVAGRDAPAARRHRRSTTTPPTRSTVCTPSSRISSSSIRVLV